MYTALDDSSLAPVAGSPNPAKTLMDGSPRSTRSSKTERRLLATQSLLAARNDRPLVCTDLSWPGSAHRGGALVAGETSGGHPDRHHDGISLSRGHLEDRGDGGFDALMWTPRWMCGAAQDALRTRFS